MLNLTAELWSDIPGLLLCSVQGHSLSYTEREPSCVCMESPMEVEQGPTSGLLLGPT